MTPYSDLPETAFWKTGTAEENPFDVKGLYKKKWDIRPEQKIATAGSCFAQRISQFLKSAGYRVIDVEPTPGTLPQSVAQSFGYGMTSARYGNIYTLAQLHQLLREATGAIEISQEDMAWERPDGAFVDAFRPAVEPQGLPSIEAVAESRAFHLERVREMFREMDIFVFTLGLTETWRHKKTGLIYPSAPGIFGGEFNRDDFELWNIDFPENITLFKQFHRELMAFRGKRKLRYILTVSPVAMTATATGDHILSANTYSKSLLRTVAGHLSKTKTNVDYFPGYEIIVNQAARSAYYESNLRTIRPEGVNAAMRAFFEQHPVIVAPDAGGPAVPTASEEDVQCEEAVLEAFQT